MNDHSNDVDDPQDGTPPATTREGLLDTGAEDLISAGLAESTPPPAGDDAGDDDASNTDDQASANADGQASAAADGQGVKPAADGQAAPPPRTDADFVEMLVLNPERATEVPEKKRADMLARAGRIRAALEPQVARALLDRVDAQNAQRDAVEEVIGPFRELEAAQDSEALAALEASEPEAAELYHRVKAAESGARVPEKALPPETVRLQAQAREYMGYLRGDEAAIGRIHANYNADKYPPTAAGLAAMKADIDAEVAAASAPARKPLTPEQRAANARARATLPRVDATPGGPPPDGRKSGKEMRDPKTSGTSLIEAALAS